MQRWRHICTNRPPPDHLRATYAQPARRCAPSHARPAMMNVIHVSQRCQRLVGNYVSAGRGFRWHLLGTNPPRTPGPQREPAANSRASARNRRKLPRRGTNQPQAHPPRHETAASFGASAPDRRGLFRPSTQPTGPRPFRADTVTPLTPASTLPQVTGFRYAALAPYLHEPPTAGPIRAAYGQPGPPWPGTAHEITIHGLDRDLVGDAAGHRRRDHDSRPGSRSRGRCDCRGRCECRGRRGRHEPRLPYSTGLGDVGTHASVSRPPSQPRNAMPVITPQTMKPA